MTLRRVVMGAVAFALLTAGCSDSSPSVAASIESFESASSGGPEDIVIKARFTNPTETDTEIRCSITLFEERGISDDDAIHSPTIVPAGGAVEAPVRIQIELLAKEITEIEVRRCQSVGGI